MHSSAGISHIGTQGRPLPNICNEDMVKVLDFLLNKFRLHTKIDIAYIKGTNSMQSMHRHNRLYNAAISKNIIYAEDTCLTEISVEKIQQANSYNCDPLL